jgi:hypothetical protein
LKLSFYRIYPIFYEFQKFETYLEIDLNNSKDKRKRLLLQWATPAVALGPTGESVQAHVGLSARDETGEPRPFLTGAWLACRIQPTGGEWSGKEVPGS